MNDNNDLDPRLAEMFEDVKDVAPRDSLSAARGRGKFLSQAVSVAEKARHSKWTIFTTKRKEKFAMNVLISALVIAGLLFGGGATVYAAQDDLPNEPLYQIKLMTEETRLLMNSDPQVKARRMIQSIEHPVLGHFPVTASPIKLSKTPLDAQFSSAPTLGQDTVDVLRTFLGLDEGAISELLVEGAVTAGPG